MKKLFRILGVLLLLLLLVIGGSLLYISKALPNIPVDESLRVEITPARVERGEYLANHVCLCMDCHSTRDWNLYTAPRLREPRVLAVRSSTAQCSSRGNCIRAT